VAVKKFAEKTTGKEIDDPRHTNQTTMQRVTNNKGGAKGEGAEKVLQRFLGLKIREGEKNQGKREDPAPDRWGSESVYARGARGAGNLVHSTDRGRGSEKTYVKYGA